MAYTQWDLYGAILSGSIGGGIVAVAAQRAIDWIRQPKIEIRFDPSSACTDTPYRSEGLVTRARYLRVRVKNTGQSAAKGCRVLVRSITKTDTAGTTTKITEDDWFDLSWAYGSINDGTAFSTTIPRAVTRHADVAFVVENRGLQGLSMASSNFPHRLEQYFNGPGKFTAEIVVAGENFPPALASVAFDFGGAMSSFRAIQPR